VTTQLDPNAIPDDEKSREQLGVELRQLAKEAIKRGELITAMLHASDALMLFPNDRTYLDLVDHIAQGTQDPLSLVPVATGSVHPATAAVRARILMTQQKLDEAVDLLCQVVEAAPHIPYLEWLTRWLQPHVITRLGWDFLSGTLVRTALRVGTRLGVPPHPKDPRLPNVAAAAQLFAAMRAQFTVSMLFAGEAMLRRRLGDPQATLAVATEAAHRFPEDWRAQVCAMNAFGDARQPDHALAHARKAMALDPKDNAPLRDAAFAFLDAERPAEAVNLLQELLQREPDYSGAKAAFHYARFRAFNSEPDKQQLLELRERQWWDEDARHLAEKVAPSVMYVNYLPGPGDATASAARHISRELGHVIRCCGLNAEVKYSVTSQYFESPSVGIAFDLAMRAMGARGKFDVSVEEAQSPDPRVDKAGVAYRLWNYNDMVPQRVYPEADQRCKDAIAQIAGQLYELGAWDAAARAVGQQLGPDWIHPFLAVMTDPPLPPEHGDFDAVFWTYRCQIATALVLSNVGDWATGPGRNAVFALVYGPSDWTTSAGLVALAARANGPGRAEIEQVFQWLRTQIPERGFTTWEQPLQHLWLSLPGIAPQQKQELEAWIEHYEVELPRKNRVRPPERRYGGLTLEQYAEFSTERDKILGPVGYQGVGAMQNAINQPPPDLVALMERFGLPARDPNRFNACYPFIPEWQEALNANPGLMERFIDIKENLDFARMGVSKDEKAALDQIRGGEMDMHLRMAQQQAAQRQAAEGNGGDPDPEVFPGQRVARLSDYVGILKGMQRGDMMGALAAYGLDMMSYGSVATAWGAKLAADPMLTEKFSRMMQS
jgi:tetratricopeptide (TPR) repeat protein